MSKNSCISSGEEEYVGAKFKTNLIKAVPYSDEVQFVKDLLKYCRLFERHGFAPRHEKSSYGNLSTRSAAGFLITASCSNFDNIDHEDLVEVISYDKDANAVCALGMKDLSSESIMHYLIYEKRKDVNAIFHGHCNEILAGAYKLAIPETDKFYAYGSIELAEAAAKMADNDFFILKDHGFVSLGKTMEQAWQHVVDVYDKIRNEGDGNEFNKNR